MYSSPRFTRGTSIIAALVFAALLGAIAIGLNSWESNSSVNTSALPADAAAAVTQSDQTCKDGEDFNYTVTTQTNVTSLPAYEDFSGSSGSYQEQNAVNKPQVVQICPTDAEALQQATQKQGVYMYQGQWVNLPASLVLAPLVSSRSAASCSAGKTTSEAVPADLCTYVKQANNTYVLKSWMCRVTFTNPTQGVSQGDACWVKDVPVQEGVNATPPPPAFGGLNSLQNCPAGATDTSNCIQGGSAAATPTVTPDQGIAVSCSQAGSDPATCIPSTNLPTGCTQTGQTISCTGSNQTAADHLQDSLEDNVNGNYVCNYNSSNQTTSCTLDTSDAGGAVASCNGVANGTICTAAIGSGTCQNNICTPATPPPGGGQQQVTTGGAAQTPANGNNNNNGLSSLLSGLVKGLSSSLTPCTQSTSVGGNGTTLVPVQVYNPTTNSYTTQYVQQASTAGGSPCAAQQQSAPYGTGTNGAACAAPAPMPQCATGATAQPINSNGCLVGYQCVPTNSTLGQTPTPTLSCSPQVADVGQSVAISYSCTNATGSSASGFSTNNQTSGTASTTISTPPSGTNTANFGLTCTNNGQNASTQCSVQVNQPAIDLVADPQSVPSGQTASIGWVTAGMQSCVISSPDDSNFTSENASQTNVNGVAQTDAITGDTQFVLTCQTLGGQTKSASTTVSVGSGTASTTADVDVTSTADGQTINHGGTVTITWSNSNTTDASSTAAAIWLIDINTEEAISLIAGAQPTTGTYTWQVPAVGSTCDSTTYAPCAADLVDGDSYGIEVAMYTPTGAYIGPPADAPSGSVTPTYEDYGYTSNVFTIGQ